MSAVQSIPPAKMCEPWMSTESSLENAELEKKKFRIIYSLVPVQKCTEMQS